MVEELHKQNELLRQELDEMKRARSKTPVPVERTPNPKTPTTVMFTPLEPPVEPCRSTPGGTQVPPGTPPNEQGGKMHDLPDLPPWLWAKHAGKRPHAESVWAPPQHGHRELQGQYMIMVS